MKKLFIAACFLAAFCSANAQETLQSVTDRGSSTSNPISIINAYLNISNMADADVQLGATAASAATKYAWMQSSVSGRNLVFNPTNGGNVGIGTLSPSVKLDVNGAIRVQNYGNVSSQRNNNNSYTNLFLGGALQDNSNGTYTVIGDGNSNYFAAIRMDNTGSNAGAINFYTGNTTGGQEYTLTNAALTTYTRMTIVNGNVGIGTTSPTEKLSVKGKIRAQEVKVETANWPDYVFTPEHQTLSLPELEQYIQTNRHLPEIPSAAQAEKEGISLGEMNAKLVKKIEELTLYIIKLNKNQDALNAEINGLKEQFKSSK